jgi:type I restriction enzyme S subunit
MMIARLGDICDVKTGYPFKSADFSATGIRLLRGDNIAPGSLRWEGAARWEAPRPEGYELRQGDVVLAMDRPWISTGLKVAMVRDRDLPALLVQRVAALRARPGNVQRFVELIVREARFSAYVQGVQTGTGIPHISSKQIENYKVDVPPASSQRAIAAVVGALDDKIVANLSLARTADELATMRFRRMSVHAKHTASYEDFAVVGGGGTPSTKRPELWGGRICWATPTDVTALENPYLTSTSRQITPEGLDNCASPLYPAGSILMTSRATIGAFALAEVPMAVNQGFIVANPKQPKLDMWLFHEMRSRVNDYLAVANGATFLELSRGRFRTLKMLTQAPEVMENFGDQVRPLHTAARHAMRENRTLIELRDTLLPALMSGRLRVKDAERQVEDAI